VKNRKSREKKRICSEVSVNAISLELNLIVIKSNRYSIRPTAAWHLFMIQLLLRTTRLPLLPTQNAVSLKKYATDA